ncbi:MAG: hypothetical protein ABI818_18765 [Acidobacteriota bacterium]
MTPVAPAAPSMAAAARGAEGGRAGADKAKENFPRSNHDNGMSQGFTGV